jgi:hypothetical protein
MKFAGAEIGFRKLAEGELPLNPQQLEREFFDVMVRAHPELWRTCYPRIYSDPRNGQYHSSKRPARQLMTIALKVLNNQIGASEVYEYHLASHLTAFRVPMYWLSPAITEALKLTTFPGKFNWYDMPFPFEAGVFMLPKGSLRHKTDGDAVFLAYGRFRAGETYHSPLIPGKPYTSKNGGMILTASVEGGYFLHWNIPLEAYGSVITMPELQMMIKSFSTEHGTAIPLRGGSMTPADYDMGVEVAHYIFSTLMLMTARPDLVTKPSLSHRIPAKKGNLPKEFWNPAIIGENYTARREVRPSQGGTHASPRFHWVKGAWKEQPYGPNHELRRTQWIAPYARGGNDDTEKAL